MGSHRDSCKREGLREESSASPNRSSSWPFIGPDTDAKHARTIDARCEVAQLIEQFCALRQDCFNGLIHDAPFNLLIDMYICECTGRRVTVGDACLAARTPQTTALRAIQMLIDADMIVRTDDATDSRRKLLSLTDKGRERVVRFVDRVIERQHHRTTV
jgi:hypothetical protein